MSCTYDVQFPIHEDGDTAALVSHNLDTIASAQRPQRERDIFGHTQ